VPQQWNTSNLSEFLMGMGLYATCDVGPLQMLNNGDFLVESRSKQASLLIRSLDGFLLQHVPGRRPLWVRHYQGCVAFESVSLANIRETHRAPLAPSSTLVPLAPSPPPAPIAHSPALDETGGGNKSVERNMPDELMFLRALIEEDIGREKLPTSMTSSIKSSANWASLLGKLAVGHGCDS